MFQTSQKYSECQLVTAINAAAFLGEPLIEMDSHEYERLVDLVRARHGAAISIEKAYEYLRLDFEFVKPTYKEIHKALHEQKRPVEITVWTKKQGFHSVLVVNHKVIARKHYYCIPNLGEPYTDKRSWIERSKLEPLIRRLKNMGDSKGKFRVICMDDVYHIEKDPSYRWEYLSFGKFRAKGDCGFPGYKFPKDWGVGPKVDFN